MPGYDPNLDFFALLRPSATTQLVRRMPILDLLIYTLAEANLLNLYVGYAPPTTNQRATAWLLPQNPSWGGPGVIMLWDQTQNSGTGAYVAATAALFTELLNCQGNLVTQANGPPPTLGVVGSVYFRLDTGQIYYMNQYGAWTLFQTAIANIGTYITGHGGPGDPLNVNLATLEPKLIADLANKITVLTTAPITGNGTAGAPIGMNYTQAAAGLVANGGLNYNIVEAGDNVTIVGDGRSVNPFQVNPNGLSGKVPVAVDGVTVTGNGTTANPLVAHAASALVTTTSPITGNGSPGSPIGLNYTATASGLVQNGGLNRNVQVAVDGTTIQGNGTSSSPLFAASSGGAPGGTLRASGAFSLVSSAVGGAPGPPYPGFPNGIIPSTGYGQVGQCNGCTVNIAFPSSWPMAITVTFNTPQPDMNYLLLSEQNGTWYTPGSPAPSFPAWEIVSQTYSTSGFTLQVQPIGPAGYPQATFTFAIIH